MNKLLHNNTLFTLTLLGIATALAFLFFSFVSENTANIALLYIIAQILIARYTNGYLHGLFSSIFSVICINFFFTYPFFRLNFTLSGYPVTFIGMLIITLLTTATTSRLKKQTEILAKQEKQVQIARQESLRANLLRAVSHDLRTPLTSIIGTTSSLLSDDSILSDAEKRELLENIENDSSWLLNMVENLLSVTRINDTVTHQVNKTPGIVEEVVAEAVQRLKKRFPSASIIVHVPTDYLLIPMDAILIEQVLINLLENALIHSGSSHSPELTVTDHPDHVTFCVKDFGHGLNPDVIPDIFSGICHNTGSVDSHKGMGIGLSICKTIIDAHNGYIEAKNHTNGALFLFTLPKEEEENIPCSQK
ncbi:sensor histidine kinase [Coprococcus comes]|uniref:sensor histidine kinase n=1 Tax=Coprococcus comes TaxID=410072 RepID=UPI001898E5D9|nr:DUF4118 domain-containing protein [Coprococcus comes]